MVDTQVCGGLSTGLPRWLVGRNQPCPLPVEVYCHVRPHSSLGGKTPYAVYSECEPNPARLELTISGAKAVQLKAPTSVAWDVGDRQDAAIADDLVSRA